MRECGTARERARRRVAQARVYPRGATFISPAQTALICVG
jgi:hypothetical protein